MDNIIFEDRSSETQEQKLQREIIAAGQLLVGLTIQVSGARPTVGLGALAYAIGMGGARVGASLDQILDAVKQNFELTREAMADRGDELDEDAPPKAQA